MTLSDLSIKRPIFITCIIIIILVMGVLSMRKLGVDLFPKVTFPVVTVSTAYPGAGPEEVELLVSKIFEDEISTVSGIKRLSSINKENISIVVAEFTLETDVKYAEQQIRDKVSSAKIKLPKDVKESIIRRIDPADQPILVLSVTADLNEAELFDLADDKIRPQIEQVRNVGLVEVIGGRKRELRVELDRKKLKAYEVSATQVTERLKATGQNIPAGKVEENKSDVVYRTLGEFKSLTDIENTIVNFAGNDVPVTIKQIGKVIDTLQDESSRTFYNGKKSLFLMVFRQTGTNTIEVADSINKKMAKINLSLEREKGAPKLLLVRDSSKAIRANVDDVKESIFIGIFLTILVVYFFLGSGRSTLITGLALPNSLLGAFILMWVAGFTINMMTLLALSLAVGLLIDDAIVVRENIFRHIEMGESPLVAASVGTKEVTLAVVATTLAVLAVFGPIAFLQGVVGQFFKEFGMTICFAMMISLFDALTVAPMLSAYFAGTSYGINTKGLWGSTVGKLLVLFNRFQDALENKYENSLKKILARPLFTIFISSLIFLGGVAVFILFVPKTFLSPQDYGEFSVSLDMPPGTSLNAMSEVTQKVDARIRQNPEVLNSVLTIGNREKETNVASFFVELVKSKNRKVNTSQFKDRLREQLREYSFANPTVKDVDMIGGGQRPFNVNIIGNEISEVEKIAGALFAKLKTNPALKDPEISFRSGKPEFQVKIDNQKAQRMGVSSSVAGLELRNLVEGMTPAVLRNQGREYDIRVRLQDDQRNLKEAYQETYVPNINYSLVKLSHVSDAVTASGPSNILRQDRGRYIQISADLTPGGAGMGGVMKDIDESFKTDLKLPSNMSYAYVGQAENFKELGQNMLVALSLAVIFIYLVLASLYESFITPFTIMTALPLAICGAFYALWITKQSMDINSWIGCIMLMGVATKNSILIVDYTNQLLAQGLDRKAALLKACKTRLRPILMTTFALIAGMLPVAIGLNEASKQRTSMGIAIIGGLITSTLLSLVFVPASFSFIDRFRVWSKEKMSNLLSPKEEVHDRAH